VPTFLQSADFNPRETSGHGSDLDLP
jgi:hypothetical protein